MNRILGLLLGMIPAAAVAVTAVPEDFAYGIDLRIPAQGAIYRVSLPDEVYQYTTRPDLGDMRVFNGDRQVVPHMLRHPEETRQFDLPTVEPPLFPFYKEVDTQSQSLSLHLETDSRGAIVNLEQDVISGTDMQPAGYLLDISQIEKMPSRLELTWSEANPDFFVPVRLQASNDLTRWQTIKPEVTLANMRYAEHQLVKNEIAFPATEAKYLRIETASDKPFPELTSARLHFPAQTDDLPRQWLQITGSESEEVGEYHFDLGGRFPVERLNLKLPQRNTLISGTLLSRPDVESAWMYRAKGNIYHLTVNGSDLVNPDFQVNSRGDRYWKLRINKGQKLGPGVPVLSVGWRPNELVFIAQGQPPYLLAFGSSTVEKASFPVNSLLSEVRQQDDNSLLNPAHANHSYKLGGEKALQPPTEGLPWSQIVLWLVLLGVVVLLVYMAYRLYSQMQQSDSGTSG